jgi:hypothetical protein
MLCLLAYNSVAEQFQLLSLQSIKDKHIHYIQIESSRSFVLKCMMEANGNIFKFECLTSSLSMFLREIESYFLQQGVERSEIQTEETKILLPPYNIRKTKYFFTEMELFIFVTYQFELNISK